MRRVLGLIFFLLAPLAWADPRINLTPTELKFRVGIDDDIQNTSSQHTYIYFRNDGNIFYQNRTPILVRINGRTYQGMVYGPDARGGGLWDRVQVGETAKIFLRLPLGTIRHCENLNVTIDAGRTHQHGEGVFSNDTKTMTAYDMGRNRFLCNIIVDPRPRLPRDIIIP